MYLFHLCASGISAAVTVAPTIDQPISFRKRLMLTPVCLPRILPSPPPPPPPPPSPPPLLSNISFSWPQSLPGARRVHGSYHDEKWMERLAALCHRTSVVCSPSQHAKGLVVVTVKMAAASDDCNYAAYIYQDNDLPHSPSPSAASTCHTVTAAR